MKKITIKDNKMWLEEKQIEGLIRAKFVAPKTLFPFLLTRYEKKSYAVICRKCLINNQKGACAHKKKARSFIETYTIQEVAFAVDTCGYEILQIYEVLSYE